MQTFAADATKSRLNLRLGGCIALFFAVAVLFCAPLARSQTLYWDTNNSTAGAGVTPTGTWNATNTNWTTSSTGTTATTTFTSGRDVVFSAGTDATGAYAVTLGAATNVGNLTFEDGTTTITGNTLTFNRVGGSTIDVAAGRTATVNSLLAGSVALTKNGLGTFVTGGNTFNSHSGPVVINAGVFEIAKIGFIGAINNTAPVTVASGATLRFNGDSGYTQETIGSLSGGGTVTHIGAAAFNFLTGGDNTSTTFSGVITDATNNLSIQKTGTGTFTLSGANSYKGTTAINAGVLNIQHNTALGTAGNGTTVATGAALEIQNNITVTGESLALNGTGVGGNGTLRNISGTNTWTGPVTLATASRIQSDSGNLTISGNVTSANLGLTVGGAGNTNLAGVVGLGSGSLTKTDAGALTLSGAAANTYSGGTLINTGTVNLSKTAGVNALGTGAITVGDGVGAASSANLVLLANNQTLATSAVTLNSDGRMALNNFATSIATIAGTGLLDLATSGYLTIGANNASSIFGGAITGTGTLEKAGTGTLTFNSAISYAGSLKLSGGTLQLNGITATIGTLNITGNSTIDFAGSAAALNLTNLTISAGVTLNIINWANATDYFYTTNWTGASKDLTGSAPMNQIVFNSPTFTGANTKWQGYDNQVTPVPEPSTYGALFLGIVGAGLTWRRRFRDN